MCWDNQLIEQFKANDFAYNLNNSTEQNSSIKIKTKSEHLHYTIFASKKMKKDVLFFYHGNNKFWFAARLLNKL